MLLHINYNIDPKFIEMDSSNWRKLLNDDKNFDQKVPYNLQLIEDKLSFAEIDLDNLNPYYVLSPIYDFTKFFAKISSGLSMGFKDITEKVNLMRKILQQHPEIETIQQLVEKEMKLDIHKLNGENNAKKGHSKGEYKHYTSGTRTFLRLLWFMEFLIHIFRKFEKVEKKSLKDLLKDAYNEVLAPRHKWIVRQAVGMALAFSGSSKREALKIIFGYEDFTEEAKAKIKEVADKLETVWKAGNDFYAQNKILKLP